MPHQTTIREYERPGSLSAARIFLALRHSLGDFSSAFCVLPKNLTSGAVIYFILLLVCKNYANWGKWLKFSRLVLRILHL